MGNQEFAPPNKVYFSMSKDFMNSAMPFVESLLDRGLRIMFYRYFENSTIQISQPSITSDSSGNLDFICAYPLSVNAFNHMKWNGSEEYRKTDRDGFFLHGKLVGYVKKVRNFIDAMILNAGHMVPTDQPEPMLSLLDKFIRNKL